MVKTSAAIFQLLRPKQWTKNLLLFAGVIFSDHFREPDRVLSAVYGFLIFCGLSGVVYIVNDIKDAESDRNHPLKASRPIASGALTPLAAGFIGAALLLICIPTATLLSVKFLIIAMIYVFLMVLYSLWLKHVVILDLMIVAIGFVLRAIAGVYAIEKPGEIIVITPWFVTCVLFLALFIVICKRRHEIVLLSDSAVNHRPVLEHYSPAFLDQMVNVATTATVMSYALYVTLGVAATGRSAAMVYTLPFVLYGIFRYLYLVYKRDQGGSPELLFLQDPWLLVNVILWLVSVTILMFN